MIAIWKLPQRWYVASHHVIKPYDGKFPLTLLQVSRWSWLKRQGFPDGVINVVNGAGGVR